MEKTIRILAVVLAVQIVLAVGLQFSGPSLSPAAEAGPLVSVQPDQVNAITIAQSADKQVKLERADGGWTLPKDGFPADPDKVSQLLNQLTGLKAGEVVARTENARKRFQVASNDFKRRITLNTGGRDPIRIYFGTSPGKDRIHARLEGKNPIQVVQFGTYDAPVKVADWQDKGVLQIPVEKMAGLQLPGLELKRQQDSSNQAGSDQPTQWQAVSGAGDKTAQSSAVDKLARQIAGLRISEVLGTEQPSGFDWSKPALELTVKRKEADPVTFRLVKKTTKSDKKKNQSKTEYALKASSRKEHFTLSKPVARQLLNAAKKDKLLSAKKPTQSGKAKENGKTREGSKDN